MARMASRCPAQISLSELPERHDWRIHHRRGDGQRLAGLRVGLPTRPRGVWSHLFVANFYGGTIGEYTTTGATVIVLAALRIELPNIPRRRNGARAFRLRSPGSASVSTAAAPAPEQVSRSRRPLSGVRGKPVAVLRYAAGLN